MITDQDVTDTIVAAFENHPDPPDEETSTVVRRWLEKLVRREAQRGT